jgi:hypothetical protein
MRIVQAKGAYCLYTVQLRFGKTWFLVTKLGWSCVGVSLWVMEEGRERKRLRRDRMGDG